MKRFSRYYSVIVTKAYKIWSLLLHNSTAAAVCKHPSWLLFGSCIEIGELDRAVEFS